MFSSGTPGDGLTDGELIRPWMSGVKVIRGMDTAVGGVERVSMGCVTERGDETCDGFHRDADPMFYLCISWHG